MQCTAKSNRVESLFSTAQHSTAQHSTAQHSTAHSRSHEKGYHFSKIQSYGNRKKCMLERTRRGRQETTLFSAHLHYKYFKILLLYFKKYLGFKYMTLEKNEKIGCLLKFGKHLLHTIIVAYAYIVK